jgi:hypothetical protein
MQTQSIDARSSCNDFNQHMRDHGVIRNHPESYAKDHNYQHHGFDFAQTEEDIEQFLNELEAAPTWHSIGNGSCTKAWRIRNSLNKADDFNWGKIKRFKMYASSARRTDCGCHETGSFKPNKK